MIRGLAKSVSSKMDARRRRVMNFEGVVAAVFTPFKKDGLLNLDAIEPYSKYLHENGIKGIYVCGTTGEFLSLTCSERKILLEKWIEHGKNRIDLIIAHVGSGCMTEVKDMAKHAAENGVDCIATLPPLYFKPNNNEELITYMSEISAAALETPIMYYHIPSMSGHQIQLDGIVPEMMKRVPNFIGMKYTSNDLKDAVLCTARYKDTIKIFLGSDELQLNGLVSGINSSIMISSNICPSLCTAIHKAYKDKDIQRSLANQNKLIFAIDTLLKYGPMFPVFKEAMNIVSPIAVGPTRHPLLPINDVALLKTKLTPTLLGAE